MSEQKKKCRECGEEKLLNEFPKHKKSKDGHENTCKLCRRKRQVEYISTDEYQIKIKEYRKIYYQENVDIVSEYNKIYNSNHQDDIKIYNKEYNQNNVDFIRESNKRWVDENKDKINARNRKRYYNDPQYKLRGIISSRIRLELNGGVKTLKTLDLIGCSLDECRQHIEQQFLPEMNWGNWGPVWELDHILPCASFNLIDEEEQKKCFHYSNFQPLFKDTKTAESFGYINYIGNRNKQDKIL